MERTKTMIFSPIITSSMKEYRNLFLAILFGNIIRIVSIEKDVR